MLVNDVHFFGFAGKNFYPGPADAQNSDWIIPMWNSGSKSPAYLLKPTTRVFNRLARYC